MSEEIEVKARQFGWVPKEEFRGGEDKWVDAETFVKRGEEINPILRANNERLKNELSAEREKFSKELEEVKAAAEEFKRIQKEAYESKKTNLQREIDRLKQERREAIKEQDPDRQLDIEDRLEELQEEKAELAEPEPVKAPEKNAETQLDPSLKEWLGQNKWYGQDTETTEMANGIGRAIRTQMPNLIGKAFLEELDNRLHQRFPELYENPNQSRSSVDSSTSRGGSSKKTTYDTLPSEVKRECDKYVKNGLKLNKNTNEKALIAEYIELYEG